MRIEAPDENYYPTMLTICTTRVSLLNKRWNLEVLLCHTTIDLFYWGENKIRGYSRPSKYTTRGNAPFLPIPQIQRAWNFQYPWVTLIRIIYNYYSYYKYILETWWNIPAMCYITKELERIIHLVLSFLQECASKLFYIEYLYHPGVSSLRGHTYILYVKYYTQVYLTLKYLINTSL